MIYLERRLSLPACIGRKFLLERKKQNHKIFHINPKIKRSIDMYIHRQTSTVSSERSHSLTELQILTTWDDELQLHKYNFETGHLKGKTKSDGIKAEYIISVDTQI